eukprot:scaffold294_cov221-Amphora_coffeaeformis.AAC.53
MDLQNFLVAQHGAVAQRGTPCAVCDLTAATSSQHAHSQFTSPHHGGKINSLGWWYYIIPRCVDVVVTGRRSTTGALGKRYRRRRCC